MFDKTAPLRPVRASTDRSTCLRGDDARERVSCLEMMLRMTLIKPGLRASEEGMCGWKYVGCDRGANAWDESMTSPDLYLQ